MGHKNWIDNLLKVAKFHTVEDFWALHHHIELASNLNVGCDYSLFKRDIEPMWEDKENCDGGRWLFTINKSGGKGSHGKIIDDMWLEVLLCLIGEAFDKYSDQICGAVLNIRGKLDKIAVWTSDSKDIEAIRFIGNVLKERTGFNGMIAYEAHKDTQTKRGSTAKPLMTL